MLERLTIRSKLLLLLLTPLVALLAFAVSGTINRFEAASVAGRDARLAEFALASAELSTALQTERWAVGVAVSATPSESQPAAEAAATDRALERWNELVITVWDDLAVPDVRAQIVLGREHLDVRRSTTGQDRLPLPVLHAALAESAKATGALVTDLSQEAAEIELLRTLEVVQELFVMGAGLERISALGDDAIAAGGPPPDLPLVLEPTTEAIRAAFERALVSLPPSGATQLERLLADGYLPTLGSTGLPNVDGFDPIAAITAAASGSGVAERDDWSAQTATRLTALNEVVLTELARSAAHSAALAHSQQQEALVFAVLAGTIVVLALATAFVVGRSVRKPLIRLTRAAQHLSREELPALVEALRNPRQTPAPPVTPIQTRGRDEVAQLGQALADVQRATVDVAKEQGDLLHQGVSDIVVNLARRNQSLLDRQIEFIEQLERREEDPDQLDNLFRLDHLATRMRRNAESLLVLAGAEPTRRRGHRVALDDVIRVAMGEVEDFKRIRLASLDPVTLESSCAVDLAHLMAELMDNATQFSPPDSAVDIAGRHMGDGRYQVTITDRGIGMSPDQLAAANAVLTEPPPMGLELGLSLGLTVVARLGRRLHVDLVLTSGLDGGVSAVIELPAGMTERPSIEHQAAAPMPMPSPAPSTATRAPTEGRIPPDGQPPLPMRRPRGERAVQSISGSAVSVGERERSPEHVRHTLSQYRSGLRRGRQPEHSPAAGSEESS